MTAEPTPGCDAAISFAPDRGSIFTCYVPGGHDQFPQSRWHRAEHLDVRVSWNDDHPKAFRREPA